MVDFLSKIDWFALLNGATPVVIAILGFFLARFKAPVEKLLKDQENETRRRLIVKAMQGFVTLLTIGATYTTKTQLDDAVAAKLDEWVDAINAELVEAGLAKMTLKDIDIAKAAAFSQASKLNLQPLIDAARESEKA